MVGMAYNQLYPVNIMMRFARTNFAQHLTQLIKFSFFRNTWKCSLRAALVCVS